MIDVYNYLSSRVLESIALTTVESFSGRDLTYNYF